MFNRYRDNRPKTYFTNITSQITMPWNRPCCSYQLEIFRQYAQVCFRKSQKISGSYLKPFGRYLRKTWGVDKNNSPLPLIGLRVSELEGTRLKKKTSATLPLRRVSKRIIFASGLAATAGWRYVSLDAESRWEAAPAEIAAPVGRYLPEERAAMCHQWPGWRIACTAPGWYGGTWSKGRYPAAFADSLHLTCVKSDKSDALHKYGTVGFGAWTGATHLGFQNWG